MNIKKAISLIICLQLLISAFGGINVFAENNKTAEVLLNAKNVSADGFSAVKFGNSDSGIVLKNADELCWLITGNGSNGYINFSLTEAFKGGNFDGSEYDIEFDYYINGSGFVRLIYLNKNGDIDTWNAAYSESDPGWKTAKFTIDDANFWGTGVQDGFDFSITTSGVSRVGESYSGADVCIKRVKLTRHQAVTPIFAIADIDESGNTFEWYKQSKIINTMLYNYSDSNYVVDITHRLVDESGTSTTVLCEKAVTMLARGSYKSSIDFGSIKKCGLYWYEVDVASGGINSSRRITRVAVVKTSENKVKNQDSYFNVHMECYSTENVSMAVDMLEKANAGGIRNEISVSHAGANKAGQFVMNNKIAQTITEFKENGMKYLAILHGLPVENGHWNQMPATEAELLRWKEYVKFVADSTVGVVDKFEVWNEAPDNTSNGGTQAERINTYVNLVKATNEILDEINRGYKLGGPGLGGTKRYSGYYVMEDMFNAGYLNYADSITLHPYALNSADAENMDKIIEAYKTLASENGKTDTEVWATEMGSYVACDNTNSVDNHYVHGAYNVRDLLRYKALGVTDINCLYNLEMKGNVFNDMENGFGVVYPGYDGLKKYGTYFAPTEGYLIIAAYNWIMAESTGQGWLYGDENNSELSASLKSYKYKNSMLGPDVIAFYNGDDSKSRVTFSLGDNEITVYDEYGNARQIKSENGIYTLEASLAPNYISGEFENAQVISVTETDNVNTQYEAVLPKAIDLFNNFEGYKKSARIDGNAPYGFIPENNDVVQTRYLESSIDEKGNTSIKWENKEKAVRLDIPFEETARNGKLHISFDMKFENPDAMPQFYLNQIYDDDSKVCYPDNSRIKNTERWLAFNYDHAEKYADKFFTYLDGFNPERVSISERVGSVWNKYDIVVDFEKYAYEMTVSLNGEKLYSGTMFQRSPKGLNMVFWALNGVCPIYIDNFYAEHFPDGEFNNVKMLAECTSNDLQQNSVVTASFADLPKPLKDNVDKQHFKAINIETGAIYQATTLVQNGPMLQLDFGKLASGKYKLLIDDTVKDTYIGIVTGKEVCDGAEFTIKKGINQQQEYILLDSANPTEILNGEKTTFEFLHVAASGVLTVEFDLEATGNNWGLNYITPFAFTDNKYMNDEQYKKFRARLLNEKDAYAKTCEDEFAQGLILGQSGSDALVVDVSNNAAVNFENAEVLSASITTGQTTHIKLETDLNSGTVDVYVDEIHKGQLPASDERFRKIMLRRNTGGYFVNEISAGIGGLGFKSGDDTTLRIENLRAYKADAFNTNQTFDTLTEKVNSVSWQNGSNPGKSINEYLSVVSGQDGNGIEVGVPQGQLAVHKLERPVIGGDDFSIELDVKISDGDVFAMALLEKDELAKRTDGNGNMAWYGSENYSNNTVIKTKKSFLGNELLLCTGGDETVNTKGTGIYIKKDTWTHITLIHMTKDGQVGFKIKASPVPAFSSSEYEWWTSYGTTSPFFAQREYRLPDTDTYGIGFGHKDSAVKFMLDNLVVKQLDIPIYKSIYYLEDAVDDAEIDIEEFRLTRWFYTTGTWEPVYYTANTVGTIPSGKYRIEASGMNYGMDTNLKYIITKDSDELSGCLEIPEGRFKVFTGEFRIEDTKALNAKIQTNDGNIFERLYLKRRKLN